MPDTITDVAQAVSIVLFAGYGLGALFTQRMVAEFARYRLAHFRVLVGALQVAGSVGIVVGQFYRPVLLVAAGGLAAMMVLGVITRVRIKDPLYAAMPAFLLGALNVYIFVAAF